MRKVIMSVLSLMLLLVTFSSVTFAWISLPRTNIIEDISFNAKTNDGLELSLNGSDYFKEVDKESLKDIIRNASLTDITSNDGINFNTGYSKNKNVIKNRDYISFDVYFRTNTNQKNVYLANNLRRELVLYDELDRFNDNTYIISKGVEFMTPKTFLYGPKEDDIRLKGQTHTYFASDAIRISSVETSPTSKVIKEDPIVKIYDLSEDETRGFGKEYGALDYFLKEYSNVEIPKAPNTVYGLTEFNNNNIPTNTDKLDSLITVLEYVDDSGYAKGKVTFNIWIEGWDADAFDAILGDHIKIQLAFKSY